MQYDIELRVNGTAYSVSIPSNITLLQLLRQHLHLTGTKEGCGIGECGACSIVVDGKLVNACLVLAVEADGASIQTVEGQSVGEQLSDLQQAFIGHHALQCGFCTPGMLMTAQELLNRNPNPSDHEIVEAMAGNLCRCTGYQTVLDAVRYVAQARGKAGDR